MKKILIIRIVLGFIVGAIMGNLITLLVNLGYGEGASVVSPHQVEALGEVLAIILQTILSGLLGIIGFGGISFYDIESWSLLKATIAHSVSILIGFIVVFTVLQWVPFTFVSCLIIAVIVLVVYAIIWLIMYLIWKKEVEKMNEDLKAYKERE
ncbi:MAG: DUF3021 domain-containing protein [Acholeplasmataceae bacterium]|jgi:hypothetical protein